MDTSSVPMLGFSDSASSTEGDDSRMVSVLLNSSCWFCATVTSSAGQLSEEGACDEGTCKTPSTLARVESIKYDAMAVAGLSRDKGAPY